MCLLAKINKYALSCDRKGLIAYFENGDWYHIHSDELTKLEKWIHNLLINNEKD
jgi:hypothetical protein